jgi:hypothetical protein
VRAEFDVRAAGAVAKSSHVELGALRALRGRPQAQSGQVGGRFSRKAAMPSLAAAVCEAVAITSSVMA